MKVTKYVIICCILLLTSCSDDLFSLRGENAGDDGIRFGVTAEEMGKEVVSIGGSRAAAFAGTPDDGDRFIERTLHGHNPYGLKVQRQPVPLMGFNRGAVKSGENGASGLSRAAANEVVTGLTNFHDSLTIWGYTSDGTTLFHQILLTKVRNWRNSVEWPYDQGEYMKFYAVSPSLETINMSATGESYSTPPLLTYTLPEEADELLDVLYGESEHISIAAGPAGSVSTNPQQENLGKDNKFVNLRFRHITTAVRFSQGTIPSKIVIKSIAIEGSRVAGTYYPATLDAATATEGAWSFDPGAATRTYTVTASHTGTGNEGATDVPIAGTPTLFLLPQTLPSGARMIVTLTETLDESRTKDHTVTCSLAGDVWKKGYTVDYKITIGRLQEGYYLTADGNVELEHNTNAVSSTLKVQSYQLVYDYSSGTKVASYAPVTWDIDGVSADDSEWVAMSGRTAKGLSWLADFRGVLNADTHYNGGADATATYTIAGQSMALSTSHDVVLSNNSTQAASNLDLSTTYPYVGGGTHSPETANCYIVNRVGSYKFPLVYGNKSADGAEAACFKDHTGATITKRLIKDQIEAKSETDNGNGTYSRYYWTASANTTKGVPQCLRAVVLWQDVKGLISSVDNTSDAITFTIGQSNPGNAVIALQAKYLTYTNWNGEGAVAGLVDDDVWHTLWTWHIWMTDEVYQNNGTENGISHDAYYINGSETKADHIAKVQDYDTPASTYKILPVNLGWVPDDDNFGLYKPREVYIKLKQTGTDNTAEVHITQNARQELYTGTGTVYQWGRPTAFPALRNINGNVRNVYDLAGNNITSQFVLALALADGQGDAIAKPYGVLQLEGNPNSWFDVSSLDYNEATENMWNSSTKTVTKTVYDPCPPGFRVPPAKVFRTFSKTGETVVSGAGHLNMWPEAKDANGTTHRNGERSKGGYFYCTKHTGDIPAADRYGDMIYMPATAEWQGNKSVGTQLQEQSEQINQADGIYWTSDYFYQSGNSQGCILWLTPEYTFSAGTKDKPVIGFFNTEDHKSNYYGHLRAIRPMKQ